MGKREGEAKRRMLYVIGKTLDKDVEKIYNFAKLLNKNARASGWNGKNEYYNVDHIKPISRGGATVSANLWIVPGYWNQSGQPRNNDIEQAILMWVKANGVLCDVIPAHIIQMENDLAFAIFCGLVKEP